MYFFFNAKITLMIMNDGKKIQYLIAEFFFGIKVMRK